MDNTLSKLSLRVKAGQVSKFLSLFQEGFFLNFATGSSLEEVLRSAGFSREYLDARVQTVFLDGTAIDDFSTAIVKDGSVVALSAAMPGLVGAIFRRGSPIAALRSVTDAAKDPLSGPDKTEMVRIKLFNTVAEEVGPELLQRGAVFGRAGLERFLSGRREFVEQTLLEAELCGDTLAPASIFSVSFPNSEFIMLLVCESSS